MWCQLRYGLDLTGVRLKQGYLELEYNKKIGAHCMIFYSAMLFVDWLPDTQ